MATASPSRAAATAAGTANPIVARPVEIRNPRGACARQQRAAGEAARPERVPLVEPAFGLVRGEDGRTEPLGESLKRTAGQHLGGLEAGEDDEARGAGERAGDGVET